MYGLEFDAIKSLYQDSRLLNDFSYARSKIKNAPIELGGNIEFIRNLINIRFFFRFFL